MEETYIVLFSAFILGTIIGSFLNVVIYRFHTGRSLNGRSHCMTCGETLRWYELFPIVSYIVLRARCRTCGAYLPLRYLFVELLTGCAFLFLVVHYATTPLLLVLHGMLLTLLILIAVYDVRHTIIPDELSIGVGVIALVLLGVAYTNEGVQVILQAGAGGLGAGLFFFLLWYMSRGRWVGLGDAKLAIPLGIILGGSAAFSMVVLSFWIGAGISLMLLLATTVLKKGKTFLPRPLRSLTMRSEIPFAPFLIAGFICAQYLHANIFDITALFMPF